MLLLMFIMFWQDIPALGIPLKPKVKVDWTQYHDMKGVDKILTEFEKNHAGFIRKERIGISEKGRTIYGYIVTNFSQGSHRDKAGMYADANIHSNEIQGTEVILYAIWQLLENRNNPKISEILNRKSFYFIPSINPDARDHFLKQANSPHTPRSGLKAMDDDLDGSIDEDSFDDLDKDGHITMMIRKNPFGKYVKDKDYPEMLNRVEDDRFGEYEILGNEGIDNDGDGLVNEDREGFYDPNRDYAWQWEAKYVQSGANRYPFSIKDNQAVKLFVESNLNIAAGFSYHNSGGIFLRGPSVVGDESYNNEDIRVFNSIGNMGENLVPAYYEGYSLKDLYSVYGGTKDWLYAAKGIFGWTVELWSSQNLYRKKSQRGDFEKFSKELLFSDGYVQWRSFKHPQYGDIEIGGAKKIYTRMPPAFLLQEELHRNASVLIWNAYHLADLILVRTEVEALENRLYKIHIDVLNTRSFPSKARVDVERRITYPEQLRLTGNIQVISSGEKNMLMTDIKEDKLNLNPILIDRFNGKELKRFMFIVKGQGRVTIEVLAVKASNDSKTIRLN